MRRIVPMGLSLLILAAACGDDDATITTTTNPSTTAASTPAPTTITMPPSTTTTPATRIEIFFQDAGVGTMGFGVSVDGGDLCAGEACAGARVEVAVGSVVRIVVSGDVTRQLHVHGYDHTLEIAPGQSLDDRTLEFVADIPGIFEVETEEGHTVLFELVVS